MRVADLAGLCRAISLLLGIGVCAIAGPGCAKILGIEDLPPLPDERDGAPPADMDAAPSNPSDRDGDGVADSEDNCPVSNPDQADCDDDRLGDACDPESNGPDEDDDDIANACDNCPGVSNPGQENALDDDLVGDACDPRPTEGGDSIIFVELFDTDSAGPPPGWTVATGAGLDDANWRADLGALVSDANEAPSIIYLSGMELPANVAIEMRGRTLGLQLSVDSTAEVGVIAHYDNNGGTGDTGVSCAIEQPLDPRDNARVRMRTLADVISDVIDEAEWEIEFNQGYAVVHAQTGTAGMCTGTPLEQQSPPAQVSATDLPVLTGGRLGLRVVRTQHAFEYVVVYALGGPL